MQVQQAAPWVRQAIPLVVIALVVGLRLWRMRGARRLRIETLWVMPAIFVAIVAATFATSPPGAAGWGWSALALAIGGGIGWYRGGTMRITVDPETHALSQQASPASILLLFGLIALKMGARSEFGGGFAPGQAHGVSLATDIALAFALGLIAATRIEMTIRARRLLAAARAGFSPPS